MGRVCFCGNHYLNGIFLVLYSPCFKLLSSSFLNAVSFMQDFTVTLCRPLSFEYVRFIATIKDAISYCGIDLLSNWKPCACLQKLPY